MAGQGGTKMRLARALPLVVSAGVAGLFAAAPAPAADPPSTYGEPTAPLVARVHGLAVRTNDPAEMAYVVAGELVHRYAEANKIAATDPEVSTYVADMRKFIAEETARRKARKVEIERRLQEKSVPAAERQALEKEAAMIKSLFERLPTPDEAAERQIAGGFITQWKVNQALYRQYGGRVIYQQTGPEPLDAYRKFFEAEQAKGSFQILDPKFAQDFWSYYRDEKRHVFMSEAEAKAAFATPPWAHGAPAR